MASNINLEALYSYAQSQNIKIDKEEFKFQLETHPDYPSLLAFTDTLSFFNIPNIAIKLAFDEIENLENSFIALLKNENQSPALYHIIKEKDFYLLKEKNKTKKFTKEELKKQWQEIVLLSEKSENYNKNLVFDKELKGNAEIVTQDLRLIERFFFQIRKLLGYQV